MPASRYNGVLLTAAQITRDDAFIARTFKLKWEELADQRRRDGLVSIDSQESEQDHLYEVFKAYWEEFFRWKEHPDCPNINPPFEAIVKKDPGRLEEGSYPTPSYHLPAFAPYERLWLQEGDRERRYANFVGSQRMNWRANSIAETRRAMMSQMPNPVKLEPDVSSRISNMPSVLQSSSLVHPSTSKEHADMSKVLAQPTHDRTFGSFKAHTDQSDQATTVYSSPSNPFRALPEQRDFAKTTYYPSAASPTFDAPYNADQIALINVFKAREIEIETLTAENAQLTNSVHNMMKSCTEKDKEITQLQEINASQRRRMNKLESKDRQERDKKLKVLRSKIAKLETDSREKRESEAADRQGDEAGRIPGPSSRGFRNKTWRNDGVANSSRARGIKVEEGRAPYHNDRGQIRGLYQPPYIKTEPLDY